MKAVEITGEKELRIVERPEPKAKGGQALVKIIVAPMCTEYKAYKNAWKTDCLGHEAAGEVIAVGRQGPVKPGDRVVVMPLYPCGKCALCLKGDYIHCQNVLNVNEATGNPYCTATYTQYTVKNDWLLIPIPEGMSYEHASMACCGLGPTFGAMQIMQADAFDTVLIAGAGPVGLGGVINGISRGARVITIEPHPYRAKLAIELGAAVVIDPGSPDALKKIMDLTGGKGADKSIDCAGVPAVQRLLIDATRRKGHVSFIAEASELTIHVGNDMLRKGLHLHGAWHWNLSDTPGMMQAIKKMSASLDKLVTHTFPMERVKDAFELQLTGNCGKVLLYPWK